jgi:hypothetical protein
MMGDKSEDTLWFTAKAGSQLAYWKPEGLLLGIIEAHPDHPPIMHWVGGKDEELRCNSEGVPIVMVPNPLAPITVTIGVPEADFRDLPTMNFMFLDEDDDHSCTNKQRTNKNQQ